MRSFERFTLGTVQLGLPYGIHNKTGQPGEEAAVQLLDKAFRAQIANLDTSDLYGTSDNVIRMAIARGNHFKVHTKFIFNERQKDLITLLDQSLSRLGLNQVESYSFHRFSDFVESKIIWGLEGKVVKEAKATGRIKKMGASVYSCEEALEALECLWIDQIQMPLNLLDHSRRRSKVFEVARKLNKQVHVRSIFLQGLFHSPDPEIPTFLNRLKPAISELRKISKEANLSLPHLAMAYALNNPEVASIVIGLETLDQLQENIRFFESAPDLSKQVISRIEAIEVEDLSLLSPTTWKN